MSDLCKNFWKNLPLEALNPAEWEALCDGCGKCCTIKLEDIDTGALTFTSVACRLFDDDTCRCGNYALRKQLVEGCVILRPDTLDQTLQWMPQSCAYRLRSEGRPLPWWHHLVSGSWETVHEAGMSMREKTQAEYEIEEDDWQDYAIEGYF